MTSSYIIVCSLMKYRVTLLTLCGVILLMTLFQLIISVKSKGEAEADKKYLFLYIMQ